MRTIFFSLSTSAVYRNLFFFPKSVYGRLREILKNRDDSRVIFLLPVEHREKYPEFIKECAELGNKCAVEFVKVSYPKTVLEKLFFFFYSYLIYTSTTKMLATMGLRPDEPPAGGMRFLAPFKWIIANTFGRSKFVKNKIVPLLYIKIFKEKSFGALLEKYRPELVFAPHVYGHFDTRLLSECKTRGIKTIGMAAGWDHLDKYFLPFRPDVLLAQSDHVKEKAIEYQEYDPTIIKMVGYPHFDFIVDERYKMDRGELLESLKLPKDAKVLLYISGSAYCPDEPDVIETLIRWIEEGRLGKNLYLVIRPYLGGRGADRDFDEKKFEKFREHPLVRFYTRDSWGDLDKSIYFINILRHSNAIISVFTTAFLEAAVFDVPILGYTFDGYTTRPFYRSIRRFATSEHFKGVTATGGLKLAKNFGELARYLKEYLDNPKLDSDKRDFLRKKLLYKLDGRASERIISYLVKS